MMVHFFMLLSGAKEVNMIRYTFSAFFLCTVLFGLSAALAQGVPKPSKITNIPGGFFVEWDSSVEISAILPGKGLTGEFQVMFEVPSVEFISEFIDKKQSPGSDPALVTVLADYWLVRGKPERAIPLYEEALNQVELDERRKLIFQNNLAMLYSQVLKQHDKGMAIVDKALEVKKDDVTLLDTKGLIYLNSGDPGAAIPHLERAVELSCQHPLYCMHLSAAYHQTGQVGPARRYFDNIRDQLIGLAPKMTKENKAMFDDLQRFFPPVQ